MRGELPVDQQVNDEAGLLRRVANLAGLEFQRRLHVGARRDEDGPAADLARDRAVDVPGDDPAYLAVAGDELGEGAAVPVGQPDLVEGRDPGADRRMVHRDQRRRLGLDGERALQPGEPPAVECAALLARDDRVEDEQAQVAHDGRVLDRL